MRPLAKSVLALAAAIYLASVIGAALAPSAPTAPSSIGHTSCVPTTEPNSRPALQNSQLASQNLPLPAVVGFAINFHHTDNVAPYLKAVDDLAALGFNAVEVLTPAFQKNGASTDIQVKYGPGLSPTRDDLLALLRRAKSHGMTTVLMPLVLFSEPRGSEWRGKISPENWDPWWSSYRQTLDYFLAVARQADVDVLMVGSELISTEQQTDRWTDLIAYARARFPGALSYSTNWDHYQYPAFWPLLDLIGINGYWEISSNADVPSPWPDLLARWRRIRQQVLGFSQRIGRPVLLTEIGYPSLPWALKDPWNYVNSDNTPSAPEIQALGYAAFLASWSDLLSPPSSAVGQASCLPPKLATPHAAPSPLQGVFFYSWDPYHTGTPNDTGYGVQGKPALDLLRQWLATGQPPLPPQIANR